MDRLDNDAFWAPPPPGGPTVEESKFYAEDKRPPPTPSFLEKAASPAWRFGLILLVVGWAGVLIQHDFINQVALGAPLFEEPAKAGAAIALCAALRFRTRFLRIPIGLAFGASFGLLEHFTTYTEEGALQFGARVAFHGMSSALTIAAWSALEVAPDARVRWASTLPSTALHYANNVGALVLGFGSIVLPSLDAISEWWTLSVTALVAVSVGLVLARPERFLGIVQRGLRPFLLKPSGSGN